MPTPLPAFVSIVVTISVPMVWRVALVAIVVAGIMMVAVMVRMLLLALRNRLLYFNFVFLVLLLEVLVDNVYL